MSTAFLYNVGGGKKYTETTKKITANGTHTPANDERWTEVTVAVSSNLKLQATKTVTPSTSLQRVKPDTDYNGLEEVIVTAMPGGTIGDPTISYSNGKIKSSVNVLTAGYLSSGTSKTTEKSPSELDGKLIAENIKKDVTIFGVKGTYEGSTSGGGTTTPTTLELDMASTAYNWTSEKVSYEPSNYGKDYFSKVTLHRPENLSAENIKNGVKIGGITGSYVGTGSGSGGDVSRYIGLVNGTISGAITADFFGATSDTFEVRYGLFAECKDITSVQLPANTTYISPYAFYYCSSLSNCTIPDSVTRIGNYAFYNCSRLTSVVIPDSVTSIGSYAFYYCDGAEDLTISNNCKTLSSFCFSNCTGLKTVVIPDKVTTIGTSAFSGCSELGNVTIGSGVTRIFNNAFNGIYSAAIVKIYAPTPPTLDATNAFPTNTIIWVKKSTGDTILNAYKNATNWSSFTIYAQLD